VATRAKNKLEAMGRHVLNLAKKKRELNWAKRDEDRMTQ